MAAAGAAGAAATRAFFKSGCGVAIAVYDTRRGQQEGREADKVLAFYPPTAPAATQSSIVGLAQALTMFAGTFNSECPFHTMQARRHTWAMYHAEPDLWLLLVVGRGLAGPTCQPSAMGGLLRGLHASAVLLHGLLSSQLEQDPGGARVRLRLQPLLQEVASSLLQPDPAGLWALSCPLGLTGGVPLLPVSPAAFTRLQGLANALLVARLFGARPVQGLLVAWQTCLLWSSLGSGDTAALHALAARALEPAAREGPRHKTWRRPILVGGALQQQASASQQALPQPSPQPGAAPASSLLPVSTSSSSGSGSGTGSGHPPLPQSTHPSSGTGGGGESAAAAAAAAAGGSGGGLQADIMCLASAATWQFRPDGMLLPVWMAGGAEEAGGGAPAAAAGCQELPLVWLQSGGEPARLMAWHSGPLLFLLLLEPHGPAASSCAAVTASLAELLAAPAASLAASLAAELPPKHLWHVKGLRYLYQDRLAGAVRASPLRKVATLAPASLRLASDACQWAALEATAAADPTAPVLGDAAAAAAGAAADGPNGGRAPAAAMAAAASGGSDGGSAGGGGGGAGSSQQQQQRAAREAAAWESFAAGGEDEDVELVVRGTNDCWVVARHTAAGRQLTAVVERGEKEGLAGVMRRVQAFCDAECPGVFEGLA